MTPTQRTLSHLRARGWWPAVVERWLPHARVRQDLYGFADLVALAPDRPGVVAIQTTSAGNAAARRRKIAAEPMARRWLIAGNAILLHGWGKRKVKRGGKAVRWTLTEQEITLEMLDTPSSPPAE